MKIFSAAVAAALLITGGVASARDVEKFQVAVSTSGIDFSDPASVNKLRARVQRAAEAACNPDDRLNSNGAPDYACRKSMANNGEKRIAAIQGQTNSRMATLDD